MTVLAGLLLIGLASFLASLTSACFSIGGGYLLFGMTTWLFPLPTAIALQSALSLGSLFSRTHAFWAEIDWLIVRSFTAGSLLGVAMGLSLFRLMPEEGLALALARTRLLRGVIVGTFATCIILLELLRTAGYAAAGFPYARYVPHIAVATIAGLAGTYLGKRMAPFISERQFRLVLRLFISVLGARFL